MRFAAPLVAGLALIAGASFAAPQDWSKQECVAHYADLLPAALAEHHRADGLATCVAMIRQAQGMGGVQAALQQCPQS